MENTISGAPSAHLGAHATRIPEQRPLLPEQASPGQALPERDLSERDLSERDLSERDLSEEHRKASDGAARGPLVEAAVRYAELYRWEVAQGTWLEESVGSAPLCSCGDRACAVPGTHPAHPDWAAGATGVPSAVRRLWTGRPTASVLLPTGRSFDALEVPETAGFLALARTDRLGTAVGPVILTPDGRMSFLVLPGHAGRTSRLLRGLGWRPGSLDLVVRGDGAYVVAPPTRFAARGAAQWVRGPVAVVRPGSGPGPVAGPGSGSGSGSGSVAQRASGSGASRSGTSGPGASATASRGLPDAEDVLPSLAYACAREARRP